MTGVLLHVQHFSTIFAPNYKQENYNMRSLSTSMLALAMALSTTQGHATTANVPSGGKQIYIPKDLRGMNLEDSASQWSYLRMDTTENTAIFWERGFGHDLASPPPLEGHDMSVDLDNLKQKIERDYLFFRDTLQFVRQGSKSEKYRMMIMLNYSLEGTAYGGDYDQEIGALWLAPNRVKDKQLNCIAHELGHSFQLQLLADGEGDGWGGCGFYEMASQWMLWQVNPLWMDDENYHWQAYRKLTHKAFLHLENIYHSPYILEYWGMKHGREFIAELFRQGKQGDDPVMTYKQLTGMSQADFCDDMFHANCLIVNMDYPRVWNQTRRHALQLATPMTTDDKGWMSPEDSYVPENYGFNVVEVKNIKGKHKLKADFQGLEARDATPEQAAHAGWRYGFVGIKSDGQAVYGETFRQPKGKATFAWDKATTMAHVYLVVMGAPTEHWKNMGPTEDSTEPVRDAKWNYKVRVK